jgi:anion-transporting  ArsA/GET3 family ATPase
MMRDQMPAELHFITGKGGVGKSTVAAALAHRLIQKGEGPVLIVDVQGSGRSLQLHGLSRLPYINTRLPLLDDAWGARILPRDTFRQYFGLLLSLGKDNSSFAHFTSGLRSRVVDMILENKVVSAFVDVCPGLEPAVLLGKLHWEATEGRAPDTDRPWRHVIVDAPATGHGIMLFKSTFALIDVFHAGVVFKQASRIRDFVKDPARTHISIVTTAEELPMEECFDMKKGLEALGLGVQRYIINRCPPLIAGGAGSLADKIEDPTWRDEAHLIVENWKEQKDLMHDFHKRLEQAGVSPSAVNELPEVSKSDLRDAVPVLSKALETGAAI